MRRGKGQQSLDTMGVSTTIGMEFANRDLRFAVTSTVVLMPLRSVCTHIFAGIPGPASHLNSKVQPPKATKSDNFILQL